MLRKAEAKDIDALYAFKNDPNIMSRLGGFHSGLSCDDIARWIDHHNSRTDEVLWVVADCTDDTCLGHAGLYKIDHRVRSAEFAILLGHQETWGKGLGRAITNHVIEYGFFQLNLNRISLSVLAQNERARRLYDSIGFAREGVLKSAQYKDGKYLDIVCYALLRDEYRK